MNEEDSHSDREQDSPDGDDDTIASSAATLENTEDDATVVRLSSSNIVDFHSLARRLRNLDADRIDILSLFRMHLDYNEAHEVVAQLFRFSEVRMNDCRGDSVSLVVEAVFQHSSIHRLEFDSTQEPSAEVMTSLARGLQTAEHGLRELCMRVTVTTRVAQSIFLEGINQPLSMDDFERMILLKSLDLTQCEFDTEDTIPILCRGLRENVGLQALKLDNCQLHGNEMAQLLDAITHHPTMKDISLALNMGGNGVIVGAMNLLLHQGTLSVADPTQSATGSLERLNLGQQNPGHFRNANILYDALASNNTLKSLCLCENYLLRSQVPGLVHALTENRTLEELNLHDCNLRREGVEGIICNLSHFLSLKKLWLRNNAIPHSIDREMDLSHVLVSEMKKNKVLQLLDIDEWWVPDKSQRLLANRYLHLNQAGRIFLKTDSRISLPLGTWPVLLERVQTKLHSPQSTTAADLSVDESTNGEPPVISSTGDLCVHSTMFLLLKGPALCQR